SSGLPSAAGASASASGASAAGGESSSDDPASSAAGPLPPSLVAGESDCDCSSLGLPASPSTADSSASRPGSAGVCSSTASFFSSSAIYFLSSFWTSM